MSSTSPRLFALAAAAGLLLPSLSSAAPVCRAVEVDLQATAPDLQIAVWIEDAQGRFVDTAFVTRLVGQFGLANRPGTPLLKTNFRWPYGRREMTLPVWAHRRNKHYPKVVMGGSCGNNAKAGDPCNGATVNSPNAACANGLGTCDGDCVDSTIAYHPRVSSYEPFYCSPSGPSSIDAMSCASKGTFAKGAFASPPAYSLYPPRADLNMFTCSDSPDAASFASVNDLVAISGATPMARAPFSVTWFPPAGTSDGNYVLWVEASQESDFNGAHNSTNQPNQPDTVSEWDWEGHPFLGQPSIVYKVPFHLGPSGDMEVAQGYAGYGAWDGQDGNLRPPDPTITTGMPGTGAGRIAGLSIVVGGCGGTSDAGAPDAGPSDGGAPIDMTPPCAPPSPVDAPADAGAATITVVPTSTALDIHWCGPSSGPPVDHYEVRYHEGTAPITNENFLTMLAPSEPPPAPGAPGACVDSVIHGLTADHDYTVAVRAVSACGAPSYVVSQTVTLPEQMFTTLHGCFVATAAYGAPDDRAVLALRRVRDRHLLDEGNALGRLVVATYYAASPTFASAIAVDERLRAAARSLLAPIVRVADRLP